MAVKKASKSSSRAGKRKGAGRKAGARSASASRTTRSKSRKKSSGRKSSTRKKATRGIGSKTKKVLGEMLAGAAVGAVSGAAKAVIPAGATTDKGDAGRESEE